jgi:hypothetical protein
MILFIVDNIQVALIVSAQLLFIATQHLPQVRRRQAAENFSETEINLTI